MGIFSPTFERLETFQCANIENGPKNWNRLEILPKNHVRKPVSDSFMNLIRFLGKFRRLAIFR